MSVRTIICVCITVVFMLAKHSLEVGIMRERATGYSPCGIPPRGDGGGGKGDEVREVFLTKVLGGTPSGDKVVDDEVREVLLTKVLGANGNEDDEVREVLHTKVLGGPGGGKVDESTTAAA